MIMTKAAIKRHLLGFLSVTLSNDSSLLTPQRVAPRGVKFYFVRTALWVLVGWKVTQFHVLENSTL